MQIGRYTEMSYMTREWSTARGGHLCVACRSICEQDQEFGSAQIILDHLLDVLIA